MRPAKLFSAGTLAAAAVLAHSITPEFTASTSCASATATPAITIANLNDGASCACNQLAAKYGSLVLTSSSTNYTAEVTDYWDVRASLLPKCVFMPADADEVAHAVSVFTSCGSQFAIRGGGHMNVCNILSIDTIEDGF